MWLRTLFIIPEDGEVSDANQIPRAPMIFPAWQPDQRDALPLRPQPD